MKNLIKFIFNYLIVSSVLISSHSLALPNELLSINKASAETIAEMLKGVGLKKAEAIVQYRQTYGDFSTIEEITEVKGIGSAIIRQNKERISID